MSKLEANDTAHTDVFTSAMTDLQSLLRNTLGLLSLDTKAIANTAGESGRAMIGAWAMLSVGGALVCFGLAHGANTLLPVVPLGAWLGLLGVCALGLGVGLLERSRAALSGLDELHARSAKLAADSEHMGEHLEAAIESAKRNVESTIGSVRGTVASLKNATDLNHQVAHHPWALFVGAVGLGYAGGVLLPAVAARPAHVRAQYIGTNGNGPMSTRDPAINPAYARGIEDEPQGVFSKLGEVLAPQAEILREIAIGALFGLARDWAREGVSKPMEKPVDDFFDGAAKKFGGRPSTPGQYRAASMKQAS